ncbi:MAG: TrpR like protein, YerC/YecD [Candidatus Woesebacteria bacterium GW2011_GWB1_39_12]|uniref:TrpR like protein, YerC/YecD n=2 Tax=Candidatus Woeseibacteriota TaxID=1752722 RepID=A0A0G0M159_9BACT|nr:MAG: TrpR like protein, YerC/YecD [Candidatus Woesebacteria bacterium GW2011_GWB1_39_12]KKQ97908.1 MAG: TrpR like protein, YerC/YecD [Candidatus Woesebacteria bacterium GW2011_GWA1_39_12]
MRKTTYYTNPKRIEKFSREEQLDLLFDLVSAFSSVKTPFENALLMQDLLTASEIKNLAKRLRIAKLLIADENQRDISKKLHCSLATVTKVSIWLNEGGEGLKEAVSKLPKRYTYPKKLPPVPIEFHLPQAIIALSQYSLAKKQGKKIKELDHFLKGIENKKILDKSLQEAFDEEFRILASKRKRKKIIKEKS